jgi:hypothetical protein
MILVSLFIRFVLEIKSAQLFGGKIEKSYCLLLTTLQYIVYLDISQPRTGLYTSPWAGFQLTTLVVIGTDYIGSCKSNYHTITTTTACSKYKGVWCWEYLHDITEILLKVMLNNITLTLHLLDQHRWCNGERRRASLECSRSWVRDPVWSNQRLYNWYLGARYLYLNVAVEKRNISGV